MKTRLGLWIAAVAVFAAVAAGCGTSPDMLTNPQPSPTPVGRVTPGPVPTPQATPGCTIHKLCEEGAAR
jgi:hypothetical protein